MSTELKHAFRSLRRTPWYSLTVVGVIALSMALTATVFAIVDGVLFKPLPYPSADRLFVVTAGFSKMPDAMRPMASVSPSDVTAWREAMPEAQMTAFRNIGDLIVGPNEVASHTSVDSHFFDVIGTTLMGPGFDAGDFLVSAPVRPAVVTYEFWAHRLGADRSAVGKSLLDSDGSGIRIVGVLPEGFVFPSHEFLPDVMTPLVIADPRGRGRSLSVILRAPAQVSARDVSQRLTLAARELAATLPALPAPAGASERTIISRGPFDVVRLDPLRDVLTSRFGQTSRIVFGAAASLLLLACLNVTGLAVARAQDRWRDLVLRRSLGARYSDLVRLLAVESALVVGIGTIAGVWGARILLGVTVRLMSKSALFLKTPAIDARVLVLSAMAAALCVLFVTLLPARVAWRTGLRTAAGDGGTPTRSARRGGLAIVGGQVALAFVMIVGGALVASSLLRVWGEDSGFAVDRTAMLRVRPAKAMSGAAIEDFVSALGRLPGVAHAGAVDHGVLEKAFNGSVFDRPTGIALTETSDGFPIESMPVTSGYLEAASLRPIDGRVPTDREFATGAPVIVVSDVVARRYWPGQRAVGQTLLSAGRPFAVIGVVPEARYMSLDLEPSGAIYWPVAAMPKPHFYNVLVTLQPHTQIELSDLAAAVPTLCPGCVVWRDRAQMLSDALSASIRPRRFNAWLFSSFGVAALAIVGTGILGLIAMTTNRRTKEIGIRMALGATRTGVVRQILREQAVAVLAGLLAGGVISVWAVKFVSAYLYKTPLYDSAAWAAAISVLVLIAVVGGLIPALHASRIDPIRALRID